MDTGKLIAQIRDHEGCVLHAYRDSQGYLTIGIGRLIDGRLGGGISLEEAELLFANDLARAERDLDTSLMWWRRLDEVRQRALVELCLNLGIRGLLRFHDTLRRLEAGEWAAASVALLASLWAEQVGPTRAGRLAEMVRDGK